MESLAEALPKEIERVREVLGYYKEIGPAGHFGAGMIEMALHRADKAMINGDIVEIINVYKELKEIRG